MPSIIANGLVGGIIAIIAGVIIIIWPRILAYALAIYLIIVGIIAIANSL